MSSLSLSFDWLTSGNDAPEIQQTMGMFGLKIDDLSLTRNEDLWSQTIRDTVLVSAYPLAAWLVASWWRLLNEPLPPTGIKPPVDWRMAHELAAANQGFLWPRVIFASDTESMQIWSVVSNLADSQSVKYITRLEQPVSIRLAEFEQAATAFIASVIARLEATGLPETELSGLWQDVQAELSDLESIQYRRCEANLGFDPDECPETVVQDALNLVETMGAATFSELAPAYSNAIKAVPNAKLLSTQVAELTEGSGLAGRVEVSIDVSPNSAARAKAPWQTAHEFAAQLRHRIDAGEAPVTDHTLCELLGLCNSDYEGWRPVNRQQVAIAIPQSNAGFKFHPRKKHPTAKRFELARFLGDYLLYSNRSESWLASTDLRTARQKYQRAFAAEFLCPFSSLQAYLAEDYSESAIEEAAEYFCVSQQTVESILLNNGLISTPQSARDIETSLPY